jgi:hypothetical protein
VGGYGTLKRRFLSWSAKGENGMRRRWLLGAAQIDNSDPIS